MIRSLYIGMSAALLLAGCEGLPIKMGDPAAKTVATGSAAGSSSQNASAQLEHCDKTLGTLAVVEDQASPWYHHLTQQYGLPSTVPLLRLLAQQSGCFVVVERGRGLEHVQQERAIRDSGEMRGASKFEKGQIVAADYSMTPTIVFKQKDTGGIRGAAGALGSAFGVGGLIAGAVAGSLQFSDASTTLTMVDNRSGVQLAASEGSARSTDFGAFGALIGGGAAGGLGAYSNTPEGKVIAAAFADSYNQLVRAVRSYKAQEVEGGLGTGGGLGVQGGSTPASKALDKKK